jgi:hypothetical protein
VVKFLHYLVYFFFYSQTFVREPQSYIKKDHKGERIVVVRCSLYNHTHMLGSYRCTSHTVGEAAPSAKPPDIAPVSNSRPSQSQSSGSTPLAYSKLLLRSYMNLRPAEGPVGGLRLPYKTGGRRYRSEHPFISQS